MFRCDDTAYGQGAGGELTYPVSVPAGGSRTIWFTVAGSDQGMSDAQAQFQAASADPAAELAAKVTARQRLNDQTRVSLPGDPALAQSVTWSKQDLADLTQQADNLKIRATEEGTLYPAPLATVPSIRFEGAGFPDYPWMFATDQEYTMFALLAAGQFATAEAGLRSLAAASDIANNRSGKVVHETVTDGSVYFGLNDEPGDIDETAKFPDAVAMVWRWTGDSSFRDQMYDFTKRNMEYMVNTLAESDDVWPDGSGNVEATDKIEIRKDAKLVGDIKTARIVIEDGAFFKGSIDIVKPEPVKGPAKPMQQQHGAPGQNANPATVAASAPDIKR